MAKEFEKILEDKKIRPTAMRLLVLKFMLEQSHAVSLNELEGQMSHSDRVTLFRTIKTFEEKGLVHRIEEGSGISKFAMCSDDCEVSCHHDLHIHFYCNSCKETYCLPKTHVPEVSLPNKFKLQEINLMAKGICDKCST